jgi:transcriptional regulator with XRE-family HTH domain
LPKSAVPEIEPSRRRRVTVVGIDGRGSAYFCRLSLSFLMMMGDAPMSRVPVDRKALNAIDVHVGKKLRSRRMILGKSQEWLGEQLDLSFQQVQKYEKGINRVGAGRLQQISDALGVKPSYFFEDAPGTGKSSPTSREDEVSQSDLTALLATRDGINLVRGFRAIKHKQSRETILALIAAIAKAQ